MIDRKAENPVPLRELTWDKEKKVTRKLFGDMSLAREMNEQAYVNGLGDLKQEVAQLLSARAAVQFLNGPDVIHDILLDVFNKSMSHSEKPQNTSRGRSISIMEARVLIRAYSLDNSDLTLRQIAEIEGLRRAAEVAQVVKRARREIAEKISPRNAWED